MQPEIKILFTDRQLLAYRSLSRNGVDRLLYGGAKGGGKSWFLGVWCFNYAMDVIRRFNLKRTKNPLHIGWMGRKQAVDFTGTTLDTWRKVIPESLYKLRGGTEKEVKHILIDDTVAIDYGGLDKQENINKFNSAEYGFIAVDQAEETTRNDLKEAKLSLRMTINGESLPYKELYTANPRICWLKEDFIDNHLPGNVFVPALIKDNPHIPDGYKKRLEDTLAYRPELLAAYRDGDWSVVEGADQVILDKWLAKSLLFDSLVSGRIIACDVARFGDDKTVIQLLNGTDIVEKHRLESLRTTQTSNFLTELSRKNGDCPIVVDEIGVGAGVVDELYANGRTVIPFNSSAQADDPSKYYNKRAEAWWELSCAYSRGEIGNRNMYDQLRKQLVIPTYELRNGRILIESKDKIKERLNHSPDDADCYVMGIYGLMRSPDMKKRHEEIFEPLRKYHYDFDPLEASKL